MPNKGSGRSSELKKVKDSLKNQAYLRDLRPNSKAIVYSTTVGPKTALIQLTLKATF